MTTKSDVYPQFPCGELPPEPAQARLLGVYPQRPPGLLMQRVKVPQGRMRIDQWCGLAVLARDHTPGYPLHLTTRQDIELHGIRPEDLPAVQRGIAAVGLSGAAACGDSLRNIVVCPENGLRQGTWDVSPLAEAMQAVAESLPWIGRLPRKFKISISCCGQLCARPWINDFGLAVSADGRLRAILAGSLGPRPGLGLPAYDALEVGEILPLLIASLRLFYDEGDRANRGRARLRHVRERLGDEVFRQRIDELFRTEKASGVWPAPALRRVEIETPLAARLFLPLGDIAAEPALELGAAVEAAGAELRLGLEHDLLIFGTTPLAGSPQLCALREGPHVVACPGATWCTRGIVDSRAAALRIGAALSGGLSQFSSDENGTVPFCSAASDAPTVSVTGCPNNCPQAAVADIGLIGRIKKVGDRRVECFRLWAGGGKGQRPVLARELHPAVPADNIPQVVAWLASEYRQANSVSPLRFGDFITEQFTRLAQALERQHDDYEPKHHDAK